MPRTPYTVVAVLREEALCRPRVTVFRITLHDAADRRHVLYLEQPQERPVPFMAGAHLSLDERLVSAPEEEEG